WFGGQASYTYLARFELADYVILAQQYGYAAWTQLRLVFAGNVGAAVTISASDADPIEVATVTLTGVVATTGGAVGSWQPPGGGPVVIANLQIYCTASSTDAANIS